MKQSEPLKRGMTRSTAVAGATVLAILASGVYAVLREGELPAEADGANPWVQRNRQVTVGGITRPLSDVEKRDFRSDEDASAETNPTARYGRQPHIPKDANPTVASAYEALVTGQHPERTSALIMPAAFDPEAYARDPKTYLETFEPGRIWQTAQPGPGVPPLKPLVPPQHDMIQGESVRLKVQTAPLAPVTFTALDLGAFENRLPSITVAADDSGVAEALFTATPGAVFRANVIAGSPGASGQATFQLWIQPKDGLAPQQ